MKNLLRSLACFGMLSLVRRTPLAPSASPPPTPASPPPTRPSGWPKTKESSTNTTSIRSLVYMRGTVPTLAALANSDTRLRPIGRLAIYSLRSQGRRRGAARLLGEQSDRLCADCPPVDYAASNNCAASPSASAASAIRPIIMSGKFSSVTASRSKKCAWCKPACNPSGSPPCAKA